MAAESHQATSEAVLSAGSKGQAANFHFVLVSVSARRKRVQFHQIQAKEPGEPAEMATPAPSLPEGSRWPAGACGAESPNPSQISPFPPGTCVWHLNFVPFPPGPPPPFCTLPDFLIIFFFLLVKAMRANPLLRPGTVQSWLWPGWGFCKTAQEQPSTARCLPSWVESGTISKLTSFSYSEGIILITYGHVAPSSGLGPQMPYKHSTKKPPVPAPGNVVSPHSRDN